MTHPGKQADEKPSKPSTSPKKGNKERLAKALRDNLLRRKAADTRAKRP